MIPKSDNGKQISNNSSSTSSLYRRIQILFCTKDLWCYYVGFWLILTISLLAWTRTNSIAMMMSIGTTTPTQHSETASSSGTTIRKKKVVTAAKEKKPGYRFVLNQTAEDIRIKKQYAAKDSIPLCRRYQIVSGQWLSVKYEKPPYVTTVQHLRCYPSDDYHQSPWHTYTWMPDLAAIGACSFAEYNTDDFCDLLPRATISIIGDSLSWEQYRSLVQYHNVPTRQGYQHQSFELNMNIQQSICDGGTTAVVYRRDDTLQHVEESIQQNFPTVLILNRGAHYVPDDQLKEEMKSLIGVIQKWLRTCEDKYNIECHFFWRTTVPGHVGCNTSELAIHTPVYNLHDIEKHLIRNKTLYNDVSREYHWYDFQHQNEIVLDLFKESGLSESLQFQVIDAYPINTLRPDEHRAHDGDCLHSCFPGKMDVYNRLLLHYIKMRRSINDIKRLQTVAANNDWPINIETEYDADATKKAREIRLEKELAELQRATDTTKSTTDKKVESTGSSKDAHERSSSSKGDSSSIISKSENSHSENDSARQEDTDAGVVVTDRKEDTNAKTNEHKDGKTDEQNDKKDEHNDKKYEHNDKIEIADEGGHGDENKDVNTNERNRNDDENEDENTEADEEFDDNENEDGDEDANENDDDDEDNDDDEDEDSDNGDGNDDNQSDDSEDSE